MDYLCYDWEESRKDYVWEEGVDWEAYNAACSAAAETYNNSLETDTEPSTSYNTLQEYIDSVAPIENYTIEGHWVLVN